MCNTNNPGFNTAVWKLSTVIANLKGANLKVLTFADLLHQKLLNGDQEIQESTVLSAYNNCFTEPVARIFPSLQKLVTRLGYIQFELLSLLNTIGDRETNHDDLQLIADALGMIPTIKTMAECEIRLSGIIHSLTHEELAIAKQQMYTKELYIKRGTVSNHVFTLIKLGREATKSKKRGIVLKLIENQLQIWRELAYVGKKSPVSPKLERELLTVCHWVPQSLEEAEELYQKSIKLLADLNSNKPKPEVKDPWGRVTEEPLELELVAADNWEVLAKLVPKSDIKIIQTLVDTDQHLEALTGPKTIMLNLHAIPEPDLELEL